jgi:hypothetical protein
LLAISSIESTCGQKPTRLLMRYGEERSPHSSTSGSLEVNATFFETENMGKFDHKSDEGIFLGYSTNGRAYKVFNKRIETMMESINV